MDFEVYLVHLSVTFCLQLKILKSITNNLENIRQIEMK